MPTISVVGLGPGPLSLLTKEAEQELLRAPKVFFRTNKYPAYDWLRSLGKTLVAFDGVYSFRWPHADQMYGFMVDALLKEATNTGSAVYALPGDPHILELTTTLLRERGRAAGIEVKVVAGLSFIEIALNAIEVDAGDGLQIVLPRRHVARGLFSPLLAMLVCLIEAKLHLSDPHSVDQTAAWLLNAYPPDHAVTLIWTSGLPAYDVERKRFALADLEREYGEGRYFSSLFVPPLARDDD